VAAREDQLEALVGNCRVLVVGELRRPCEQLRLARERLLAPDPVDRAVARRRDDPRARVRGRAVARPPLQRNREGILHRILGEVEIAEDAAQNRDAARTFVTEGAGDVVYAPAPVRSTTGLISIFPSRAEGIFAAHSIASSSDSASIR